MRVRRNEPLQNKNSLALAATAAAYVSVSSNAELEQALAWAEQHNKAVIALGQGSNIVLAGDVDALFIRQGCSGVKVIEDNADTVIIDVAAGKNWHTLVAWSLAQGYTGLENLALIPGSAGAAPVQNIGAYGVEIASCIRRISAMRISDGKFVTFSKSECKFAYRDSIFRGVLKDKLIITSIELSLSKTPSVQLSYPALSHYFEKCRIRNPDPQAVFNAVVDIRQGKLPDPEKIPNAGSFFKNPTVSQDKLTKLLSLAPNVPHYPQPDGRIKLAAAWLIEADGWKGKRCGQFGVHPDHALVLVNYGGDSGKQLLALADSIRTSVLQQYGVKLDIEPRVYGGE